MSDPLSAQHLGIINIDDEWETDRKMLVKACAEYDVRFDIDVFARPENALSHIFYTQEDSAFNHEIKLDAFANPMYSEIKKCMKFLWEQHVKHNNTIIILAYAKTDTIWWHDYVEDKAEVHFIKGRLRFKINNIFPRWCKYCKKRYIQIDTRCPIHHYYMAQNVAPYGSAWIIYRGK